MSKKFIVSIVSVFLLIVVVLSWHFVNLKHNAKPAVTTNQTKTKVQPSVQPSKQPATGFTQTTFAKLQTLDQETIRDLVKQARKLGDPQATPEQCSLLTVGNVHYAITSFWDPSFYRDPTIWKAPTQDNLWNPNLKKDISEPGAWMIALLTESSKTTLPDVALRWAAPPANLAPPPVSQTEPVAQACNAGWNEILKQKYAFFTFVKATAVGNNLQMHFTVVKVDKPQKVMVTVPINGTFNAWSLGAITIQNE